MLAQKRTLLRVLALSLAALGLQSTPTAQAQVTQATPAISETASMAARSVARVALLDLRIVGEPVERDFRVAAEILEIAASLDPADEDILRLLIEAWDAAGNSDRVDELSRRLMEMDPRDTVAQLRVISGRIGRLQDADSRLAAFEKFLGKQGEGIDGSVRSRLALDAALLLRERGDMEGFVARLSQACSLDSTNKDAAALAHAFFTEKSEDPLGRFEMLLNVLKADPFDPQTHMGMARELANAGAYAASYRFFESLSMLRRARGERSGEDETNEHEAAHWNSVGARTIIKLMTDDVADARLEAEERIRSMTENGMPTADVATPADVRLPLSSERTRLLAAVGLGDETIISHALTESVETIRRSLEVIADPEKRGDQITQEDADRLTVTLMTEREWLRLWAGRQIDEAAAGMDALRANPLVDPATMGRMDAWLLLRRGDLDAAQRALNALSSQDPLAEMGLAVLAEARQETGEAVRRYSDLSARLSGSIAGACARERVKTLTGKDVERTSVAQGLERLAAGVPRSLELMIADPSRFQGLVSSIETADVQPFDKIVMRIRLRNVSSDWTLGVGPEGPISSRIMLVPLAELGIQRIGAAQMQQVMTLNRRLRLGPREEIDARVWPDPGVLGVVLNKAVAVPARVSWRLVQGFRLSDKGFVDVGPLCLATDTKRLHRRSSDKSSVTASALVGFIESGTVREAAEALLSAVSRWTEAAGPLTLAKEDRTLIISALVKRLATLDAPGRLLMLALIPTAANAEQVEIFDAAVAADPDERVAKFIVLARLGSADHPGLNAASWVGKPAVADLATLARERLVDGIPTYASTGGRLDAEPEPAPKPAVPAPGASK